MNLHHNNCLKGKIPHCTGKSLNSIDFTGDFTFFDWSVLPPFAHGDGVNSLITLSPTQDFTRDAAP